MRLEDNPEYSSTLLIDWVNTDTRDLDGDSQMGDLTSSSSDDAMFPSANNTDADLTASKNLHALSSPPSSQQKHSTQVDDAMERMDDMDAEKAGLEKGAEDRFVPGATWNNKKAKDEWSRAWIIVEDRDFSLRKSIVY